MKAFAITHKGIEDICVDEIIDILKLNKKNIQIKDSAVIFNVKNLKDMCKLSYKAQSIIRILFLFDSFNINNEDLNKTIEIINNKTKKISFSKWLDKETTFMVRCQRIGKHDFSSGDISGEIGKSIIKTIRHKYKYTPKVNLKNPDVVFFVFINNNKCYLGIDFSGFDMSKRDYKIFNISGSLKGTLAYALVRLSGFKNSMMNPLTRAGVLCIESALFASNFPVNYYKKKDFAFLKLKHLKNIDFDKFFDNIDKKIKKKITQKIYCFNNDMRNVQAAKKNAKIAGIQRLISFGKVDLEWLDTRFDKGKIQSIVSVIDFSKDSNINDNKKFCDELFYQSEFILNKKGKVVILSNNLDLIKESAKKHKFKLSEERSIFSGKRELKIIVFKKG